MFNYFMENNDIFKMITPEDEFKFKYPTFYLEPIKSSATVSGQTSSWVRWQLSSLSIRFCSDILLPTLKLIDFDLDLTSSSM